MYGYANKILRGMRDYHWRVEDIMNNKVHNKKLAKKICDKFDSHISLCGFDGKSYSQCRNEVFDLWLDTKEGKKWKNTSQK